MNNRKEKIIKDEVHILLLNDLKEKLTNYYLKLFVQKKEGKYYISNIPFVYNGQLRDLKENLAYDASDLNEDDLSFYYPLIKSLIKNEDESYHLVYIPKKVLKRNLFS